MVMRTALLIFTAAVLAGCQAAPQPRPVARYSKAGATNDMFQKDRFECIQASKIQVGNAFYGRDAGFAQIQRPSRPRNHGQLPGCAYNR